MRCFFIFWETTVFVYNHMTQFSIIYTKTCSPLDRFRKSSATEWQVNPWNRTTFKVWIKISIYQCTITINWCFYKIWCIDIYLWKKLMTSMFDVDGPSTFNRSRYRTFSGNHVYSSFLIQITNTYTLHSKHYYVKLSFHWI